MNGIMLILIMPSDIILCVLRHSVIKMRDIMQDVIAPQIDFILNVSILIFICSTF
jgi:hypothetical protein